MSIEFEGSRRHEDFFPTDTHAHLSYLGKRGLPLSGIFKSWAEAGGGFILDIGTEAGDLGERKKIVAQALEDLGPGCFNVGFSAGIWPSREAVEDSESRLAILKEDLRDESVLALGECGLDYHWLPDMRKRQLALFEAQAALALSMCKPLIVHSREAFDDTFSLLKSISPSLKGVIHCFSYGAGEAKLFADMGFLVSFAGNITYKNAENLREAVRALPLDMILVETDSPYLAPVPRRGKPSSPLDVGLTIRFMAELLGIDPGDLCALLAENAARLFIDRASR